MGCNRVRVDYSNDVIPFFMNKIYTVHNNTYHRDIGDINSLRKAQEDPKRETCWEEDDAWLRRFATHEINQMISAVDS